MKHLWPLPLLMAVLLSAASPGSLYPTYLDSGQKQEIHAFSHPLVLAKKLPKGYELKKISVKNDAKNPEYQVDYRCFCAGLNYTISILGRTQAFDLALAQTVEEIPHKQLGTLKLGAYPAVPAQGLSKPFHMTHWFGRGKLRHTVITGLGGNPAPRQDLLIFLQDLETIHAQP